MVLVDMTEEKHMQKEIQLGIKENSMLTMI